MIDDLAGIAVTHNGILKPANDWGYGLDSKDSLWNYFERNLLDKYPEIKGTIFYATQTYNFQNRNGGYQILRREIDEGFKSFIKGIGKNFELAFHGTTHGKYLDGNNPELKNNYLQEFEYSTLEDIPKLRGEIKRIQDFLGINFYGGKYCGYKKK